MNFNSNWVNMFGNKKLFLILNAPINIFKPTEKPYYFILCETLIDLKTFDILKMITSLQLGALIIVEII